jgi:sorbitol/mannitol transport system substrate-binding protein
MDWKAQFDSRRVGQCAQLLRQPDERSGPAGYATNGFNENLSLFQQGLCGMWIDATVAASFVTNPDDRSCRQRRLRACARQDGLGKRSNWLWAWALAIPAGTQQSDAALQFIEWATSKPTTSSWSPKTKAGPTCPRARAPRSTRTRTTRKVPFAQMTLDSIRGRPEQPDRRSGALHGIQFVAIPEFAGIATEVSQEFSAPTPVSRPSKRRWRKSPGITNEAMEAAGYQ